MPTKNPEKVADFNQYLMSLIADLRSDVTQGENKMSTYRYWIIYSLFGPKVFGPGPAEKTLISEDLIIYENDPNGPVGIKAKGLTKAGMTELIGDLDALKGDKVLREDLETLFKSNPAMRKDLDRIMQVIIATIQHRRTECRILVIQPNVPDMLQSSIDAGNPDTIFGFKTPKVLKPLTMGMNVFKNLIENLAGAKVPDLETITQIKNKIVKTVGSSFSIIAWAAIFSGVRAIWGKIPVMLGPVPLKHVNYVEIARSGKVLKFRATGSVFLARQEGGPDAIRIEGIMYKIEFLWMFLLWALFLYGQSKFKDIDKLINPTGGKSIFEIRKLNELIMTDSSLEKSSYEYHQVFPFVSRHFIIPHCYIETILIEDKLPLKDVLKYTILLRTYDKPKQVNWFQRSENKRLYGIPSKSLSAKVCEASLNAGWRMLNAQGLFIDETEWKIGSAEKEGVLDTYYDVDWSTYATISYLTLMGAVT